MADRNLVLQLLITARDTASEVVGRVGAGVRGIGDAVSAALEPLRTFGGLMATAVGIGGAKELQERSDAYTRLTNSLKTATQSEEDYLTARKTVIAIAERTHSDLETTASLYARISQNAKTMNISQAQTADLTELIAKGMQLGGASAAEYSAATLQLTQAFGAGVLRGEEFNSVMEASPELMRKLASGLGVAIGELRGLAEQGVLTSSLVAQALLSQKDAIDAAYGETVKTVEQAFTNLGSKITLFVGQLGESTGASAGAANAIQFLSENLNVVAATLGGALVASIAKSTTAMVGYVQASLAARKATQDQAVLEASRAAATVAAAESQVAATQAAYNRALAEQRLAQQIVVAMQAELGYGVTETELAAARANAAAAANAATTATQRYAAAQAELAALQAGAATSAGLFSRAMGFLAGPGGLILLAASAFAALLPVLSKNKTGLDDLAAGTDRYKDSLAKLTSAQLEAKANDLSTAIREQQSAMAAAQSEVDRLATGHRNLWEVMKDGRPAAVQLTEAEAKLATEQQKLSQLQENLRTTTDALVSAKQQQTDIDGKQLVQYVQQGLAMETFVKTLEHVSAQQKEVSDATQARLESEIALANAVGDLQKAETLTVELAKAKAKATQTQAEFDHAAAVATQARVTAMENEYKGYQQLSPVQTKALADAQADAAAKDAQAKASAALAAQLEQQANKTAALALAGGALLLQREKEAAQASNYVKAVEALADAQTAGIRAELKLTEAKGQTATAQRLARELAIKEAEASLAVAKAKEAEQIMEFNLAKAKLNQVIALREKNLATQQDVEIAGLSAQAELAQAQAAQTNTAAQTALLDQVRAGTPARAANNEAIRDGTAALSDYADISEEAAAAQKELAEAAAAAAEKAAQLKAQGELVSDVLSGWTDRLSALSPAARQAFDGFTEGADIANASLEELSQRSSELGKEIATALTTVAVGGFADWARSTALRALEIEQAFLDQKTAVEQAVEALNAYTDGGRLTAEAQQALALKTDDVRNRFSLLNDEDLSKLRQAIDDATARMDELRQASEDALSAAQQALLEEQGNKVGVLQIQQKEKELELQKQINEAKAAGDAEAIRNLQTALDLEQQTYALKIKKAQTDATSSSASTSSKSSGGGEYTLHLKVGSETLNTTTGTDPTSFLRAIENAKRSAA